MSRRERERKRVTHGKITAKYMNFPVDLIPFCWPMNSKTTEKIIAAMMGQLRAPVQQCGDDNFVENRS